MTLAVIVAVYEIRPEWLMECLVSIGASAAMAPDVTVDVRVGVDGCEATAAVLEQLGRPYAWSPVNVGTYVLRNSLIALAPADAYAMFDADDVMLPVYVPVVTRTLESAALVGPSRTDVDADLRPLKYHLYRHGVCAFREDLRARLGGFKDERLGADVDFVARARTIRQHPAITGEACFLRRRHPASLTQAPATGFGSAQRQQALKLMERQRHNAGHRVYIHPATVALELRAGREAVA